MRRLPGWCRLDVVGEKIEKENFNTLKTKGYHFEHNFGHGELNLSGDIAVAQRFDILVPHGLGVP
jgi:hypothetical protein